MTSHLKGLTVGELITEYFAAKCDTALYAAKPQTYINIIEMYERELNGRKSAEYPCQEKYVIERCHN